MRQLAFLWMPARWLRHGLGLPSRYRPSQGRSELARELTEAGLELVELAPVSLLFLDKALLLAVPVPVGTR